MLIHWIWLASCTGLSEREKFALLQHYQDPEDIFYADLSDVLKDKPAALEALQNKDLKEARGILDACNRKDIRICTYQDAAYPAKLRNIADPPLVLYYKGNLPDFEDAPAIAIVGTRKASAYGASTSQKMGYQVAKCGAIVVTGLAEGNDGAAAKGALMAEGTVVGVLGCGVDRVYPAFHRSLYADTQRCGCLLSEYPPDTPPYPWNFPKRNRIISGLSNGVLVVEAPAKSGSLITARDAAEQGRDVFVVPGNIDVDTFAGSNALLREGATAVVCGWDIVSEYVAMYPESVRPYRAEGYPIVSNNTEKKLPKVAQEPVSLQKTRISDKGSEKKPIDKLQKQPYHVIHDALSEDEKRILARLEQGECLFDEIIADSGMNAAAVSSVLTMLQIKGIVEKKPGNIVSLK